MNQQKPKIRIAEDLVAPHKIRIPILQRSRPHNAGKARNEHHAQCNDNCIVSLMHDSDNHQCNQNSRKRIDGINDAHDHLVRHASDITG